MGSPGQGCPLSCLPSFAISLYRLRGNRLLCPASLVGGGGEGEEGALFQPIGMSSNSCFISASTSISTLISTPSLDIIQSVFAQFSKIHTIYTPIRISSKWLFIRGR